MKSIIKILTVVIAAVLIISSVYIVFFTEEEKKEPEDTNNNSQEPTDNTTNDQNNNDEPSDDNGSSYTHSVFVEEGTATWCTNCPDIAGRLHELYESADHNFYYVSLIGDKRDKADNRLIDDYNIYGYPTLFIDGGYQVLSGSGNSINDIEGAINRAELRDKPRISVSINSVYDNITNDLTNEVLIKNYENETYTGHLRVYLTEVISRWDNPFKASDGETKPYHYGFLDYVINKDISVPADSNIIVSDKRQISEFSISDVSAEELFIIAVVFNSESVEKYSYPQDNLNKFNAYYADNADATRVLPGGNLPPTVGISSPEKGKIHLFGRPLFSTLFQNTILIGKTTIEATAEDDKSVEKVEFYIDDELVKTTVEEPYEYSFRKTGIIKHLFRKHTFRAVAYDEQGKTSSSEIEVFTIFL